MAPDAGEWMMYAHCHSLSKLLMATAGVVVYPPCAPCSDILLASNVILLFKTVVELTPGNGAPVIVRDAFEARGKPMW